MKKLLIVILLFGITASYMHKVDQIQYGCFEVTKGEWTGIVCYEPPPGLME